MPVLRRSLLCATVAAALVLPALAPAAQAATPAPAPAPAAEEKGPTSWLEKILTGFDVFDALSEVWDIAATCGSTGGCLSDTSGMDEVISRLTAIENQIRDLQASTQAGFQQLQIDIQNSSYQNLSGQAQPYVSAAQDAWLNLQVASDTKQPDAKRKKALAAFLADGKRFDGPDFRTAMIAIGGDTADPLNAGGVIGAAWQLVIAKERQKQGIAVNAEPPFMTWRTVELMREVGLLWASRAAQIAAVRTAYAAATAASSAEAAVAVQESKRLGLYGDEATGHPGTLRMLASIPSAIPALTAVYTGKVEGGKGLVIGNFSPLNKITAGRRLPIVSTDSGFTLNDRAITDGQMQHYTRSGTLTRYVEFFVRQQGTTDEGEPIVTMQGKGDAQCLTASSLDDRPGYTVAIQFAPCDDESNLQKLIMSGNQIRMAGVPSKCLWINSRYDGIYYGQDRYGAGYGALDSRFTEPNAEGKAGYARLADVSFRECASDGVLSQLQGWYSQGPYPTTAAQPIASLPGAKGAGSPLGSNPDYSAADDTSARVAGIPAWSNRWQSLKPEWVAAMMKGIKDPATTLSIFDNAGVDPLDRALPAILHPALTDITSAGDNAKYEGTAWFFPTVSNTGADQSTVVWNNAEKTTTTYDSLTHPWLPRMLTYGFLADACAYQYTNKPATCAPKKAFIDANSPKASITVQTDRVRVKGQSLVVPCFCGGHGVCTGVVSVWQPRDKARWGRIPFTVADGRAKILLPIKGALLAKFATGKEIRVVLRVKFKASAYGHSREILRLPLTVIG